MTQAEYSISELADAAGTSVRTIRFYIGEGLLPAPPSQGRYAVYTEEHLDRLRLILNLKEGFLPLREIRVQMQALDWAGVKAALAAAQAGSTAPAPEARRRAVHMVKEDGTKALDYLQHIMAAPSASEPSRRLVVQSPQPSQSSDREIWEHVSLTDGIELHVRKPIDPKDQAKVAQLLHLARKIFFDDSQGGRT